MYIHIQNMYERNLAEQYCCTNNDFPNVMFMYMVVLSEFKQGDGRKERHRSRGRKFVN